ncbi:hypothetical protein [Thalassoglobus polymorphus]|uniref:Uncharacterized protein n=1 Tax=Thalassoglobus polymorphus TaxID=2527994 RepID=A0A517QJC2_9PLAN|nr:hypothetical protein [Thalassoglobus polymorphus]QDT31743.1 hypothetical protein Mal48_09790 [Thalassoglobus polymorphus]
MLRPLIFAFAFTFSQTASAITLHIDVTPELAGEKGVTMKPLDDETTRFTIRVSTKNDPEEVNPRFPFVRGGTLDVWGEHGRILRCPVHPKKQDGDLLYTFELENEHAKNSRFVLTEHLDDGQVGGGKIFSYRLIDFIDPGYRAKEFLENIRPVVLPAGTFAPDTNKPK